MDATGASGADVVPIGVTVVVVVYGEEPWLERCIASILDSVHVDVELVLVENGGSEEVIRAAETDARVAVVRPGHNTGFAEGCNLGVAAGSAPMVALVNPDATVAPDALHLLCTTAAEPGVGFVSASVRLADRPDRLNCAGNLVTVTGLSWSDHFDEPADRYPERFDVVGASGAGLAVRRPLWEELGGFDPTYFAYWEDTEVSIRAIQRGLHNVYEPRAVIVHRYEFSKNTAKFFLLERNRTITALTCFSTRHLVAVAPLVLAMEVGVLIMAARQGWLREKIRAVRSVVADRRRIGIRRRAVQAAWTGDESYLLDLLSTDLSPGNLDAGRPPQFLERLVRVYWRLARLAMRR